MAAGEKSVENYKRTGLLQTIQISQYNSKQAVWQLADIDSLLFIILDNKHLLAKRIEKLNGGDVVR